MRVFLACVAVSSYLTSVFAMLVAITSHGSDIQIILSGVFATCGTIAAFGVAALGHLERLTNVPAKEENKQ